MSAELAIPTKELLSSLREMVRQWRQNGSRLDSTGRAPPSNTNTVAPIVQAIEVTSSTADAYGYPARIQTYNGTAWSDTYSECRAVQIGSTIAGAVLATGFYPLGRLMTVAGGYHVYGVHPGASALSTIEEVDGSPSVSLPTKLQLPNSAMSNPSTGVARLLEASATTGGTINIDTGTRQVLGNGDKEFQDDVVIQGSLEVNGTDGYEVNVPYDYARLLLGTNSGFRISASTTGDGIQFVGLGGGATGLTEGWMRTFENEANRYFEIRIVNDAGSRINSLYLSSSGATLHTGSFSPASVSWGSVTGADEGAQDAVGTILTDTSTINLTYTDGTPSITADVITGTSGASIPLLNGNNTYSGSADFTDSFALSGDISPAQLTANTDDWNPTGW